MELGMGMYIFFGVTSVIGVAIGLIFSVDSLSSKFYNYFKEEKK